MFRRILICIIVVLTLLITTLILVQKRSMGITTYNYTQEDLTTYKDYLLRNTDYYLLDLTNDKYREKVNKELEIYDYNYYVVDLSRFKLAGFCMIPFKTILIDDDKTGTFYVTTLVHELLHYKYYSTNERYIEYSTFKTLYESDDPYLKKAGYIYGYSCLSTSEKDEYWCADLIINYLRKEKE